MKKIILSEKEYAKICINCPWEKCIVDAHGHCRRTDPFVPDEKRDYISSKRGKENCDG